MRLAGGRYELHEPGRLAKGKPLYRLHELAARPNDVVIVTEGKYKADRLAALGLLVTTSGAADSAGEADWPARTRVTSVSCRRSPAVVQVRAEVRARILRTFAGRA